MQRASCKQVGENCNMPKPKAKAGAWNGTAHAQQLGGSSSGQRAESGTPSASSCPTHHRRTSPARRRRQSGAWGRWKTWSCRCLPGEGFSYISRVYSSPAGPLLYWLAAHCSYDGAVQVPNTAASSKCQRPCAPDRPKKSATSPAGPTQQPELRGSMLRRGRCQLSSVKSACFMQPAY